MVFCNLHCIDICTFTQNLLQYYVNARAPFVPLHSHILSTLLKFLVTVLPLVKGWRPSSRRMGYTSTWTEQAMHKRLQEVKVAVEGDVPIAVNDSSTCFSMVLDMLQ